MSFNTLSKPRPVDLGWTGGLVVAAFTLVGVGGCESGLGRIDRHVAELISDRSAALGADAVTPRLPWPGGDRPAEGRDRSLVDEQPPTTNPPAEQLPFSPADEAQDVMLRLERYADVPAEARRMDLRSALAYATRHSREYRFAEEDYLLAALRLLSERHLWGPRLFDELDAAIEGEADEALFDTSLRLVNELRLTQRLPYGGEVTARMLARATEDLHQRVAGENTQTAELIFSADIPLLRGAGQVAREDRIQAERNLVYAARGFERFRRDFLFDIAQDFLSLVVQGQAIKNGQQRVRLSEEAEQREVALVDAGRRPPFDADLAAQATRDARDQLNRQRENFRLAVDRFKVRLGMPQDQPLIIEPSTLGLPTPKIDMDDAVQAGMAYRLDLQNRRDQLDDGRRAVRNARNALLADLNLTASISIPTDDGRDRAGLDFDLDDTSFLAGVRLDLPLDRTIEHVNLRQTQISLERTIREYERFRDSIAVDVRASVRDIDRAQFSVQLQNENVAIATRRRQSNEAAPDRSDARERSEAIDALNRALDLYDGAVRDLQVGTLRYLLNTGQLRVASDGSIRPLQGMQLPDPDAGDGDKDPPKETPSR